MVTLSQAFGKIWVFLRRIASTRFVFTVNGRPVSREAVMEWLCCYLMFLGVLLAILGWFYSKQLSRSAWRTTAWHEHGRYALIGWEFAFWTTFFVLVLSLPVFFRNSRKLGWLAVGLAFFSAYYFAFPALN
jgi:hypothetical protein